MLCHLQNAFGLSETVVLDCFQDSYSCEFMLFAQGLPPTKGLVVFGVPACVCVWVLKNCSVTDTQVMGGKEAYVLLSE